MPKVRKHEYLRGVDLHVPVKLSYIHAEPHKTGLKNAYDIGYQMLPT